jgi:hypothetical protein
VNLDKANHIKLAAGNKLLSTGSSVILPSLGVLAINAAGFTAAGVAAGISIYHCRNFLLY